MPAQPAYPGAMPGLLHFTIVANMSLQHHVCLVSMLLSRELSCNSCLLCPRQQQATALTLQELIVVLMF